MNYNKVIEIIKQLPIDKTRIQVIALFIEELGGWMQHLKGVGAMWGAAGEEVGAYAEMIKCRKCLNELHELLLN